VVAQQPTIGPSHRLAGPEVHRPRPETVFRGAARPLPRTPSGLFPSGPSRPTYREPHPVRLGAFAAGCGAAALWLLLFGLLGGDLRGYAWWTLVAAVVAWAVALGLGMAGDRGAAAGIAVATAAGLGIAATAVAVGWAVSGDWPMW